MPTVVNLQWYEVYTARFGKSFSDREAEIWEAEIMQDIRDLRPGEILDAIHAIAEDRRQAGDRSKFAPTVNDLTTAVIRNRYRVAQERKANEPQSAVCALCRGTGWMAFWTDNCVGHPMRICSPDTPRAGSQATFCWCSAGRKAAGKGVESNRTTWPRIERLWKMIRDADIARQPASRQGCPRIDDRAVVGVMDRVGDLDGVQGETREDVPF